MGDNFESDEGVVFRDVILIALLAFVAIVVLIIPHIKEDDGKHEIDSVSSMAIEVSWDSRHDIDVDLWIETPNKEVVGYSNKNGIFANLLRDDRGHLYDPTDINYEVMFIRDLPDGEYTINLHLYTARTALPLNATVKITRLGDNTSSELVKKTETLSNPQQEITVTRFYITDGKFKEIRPTIFKKVRPS